MKAFTDKVLAFMYLEESPFDRSIPARRDVFMGTDLQVLKGGQFIQETADEVRDVNYLAKVRLLSFLDPFRRLLIFFFVRFFFLIFYSPYSSWFMVSKLSQFSSWNIKRPIEADRSDLVVVFREMKS